MTIDDIVLELARINTVVTALVVEVTRGKDMIQELSQSHDQNRRELQVATARARELTLQLDQSLAQAKDLRQNVEALRQNVLPELADAFKAADPATRADVRRLLKLA